MAKSYLTYDTLNKVTFDTTPVSTNRYKLFFIQIVANLLYLRGYIKSDGSAWSWGSNQYGQLGDNTTVSRLTPVAVLGTAKTFCQIAGGQYHSLALDKNGKAWAWGYNNSGQIGDNTLVNKLTPVAVCGNHTFCQITGGQYNSLAIDNNGKAWAWGRNIYGELGDNTVVSKRTPVAVLGAAKTFCQIATGVSHTLAIDKNGKAWSWGYNSKGQLGDNTIVSKRTPVAVLGSTKTFCQISCGDVHSLGIDKNGKAWGWGYNAYGQLGESSTNYRVTPVAVCGNHTFCQISGGQYHSLGIDNNGKAWSWGFNNRGQLGDSTVDYQSTPVAVCGNHTFCQIICGQQHSLALDKNGKAWGWGYNRSLQLGNILGYYTPFPTSINNAGTKTFCKISISYNNPLAIDQNGKVWVWAPYHYRATAVLGSTKTFCQIAAGFSLSLAIDQNGKAWGWGYNYFGQLGDNTVVNKSTPVAVCGNHTFCHISSGFDHTLAIDKNGQAWAWGYNYYGQLGDNYTDSRITPVAVCGNHTFCQIATGRHYSLGIDQNGQAWGWGYNQYGQLGDNDIYYGKATPVAVLGATKTFCKIVAGIYHSLAIDKNGQAWGWGYNAYGQLGDNTFDNKSTPVAVCGGHTFCQISGGNNYTLAIDKNGQAWGWGLNDYWQLGDNTTVSKRTPVAVCGNHTFCQIYAGVDFSVAIDSNNRSWGWGLNSTYFLDYYSVYETVPKILPDAIPTTSTFCQIAAGVNYTLALDKNNKTWAWGLNVNIGSLPIHGDHMFCKISIGDYQFLAIDQNGKAWAWGRNTYGQLGDNTVISQSTPIAVLGATKTFCQIAGGNNYTLAIDKNGKAWSWGYNNYGQLGDNTIISKRTPIAVLGATKTFCCIVAGFIHSLAIDKNGKAWAWGYNANGHLGDGSVTSRRTPIAVLGVAKTFCVIAAGGSHSVAIDQNGKAWSWGYNQYGQLGANTLVSKLTPVAVYGNHTFCQIAGGQYHSLAIDNNGKAWVWGRNIYGELGDSTIVSKITPVAVCGNHTFCQILTGDYHSLAIDKNGHLWGWGRNTAGELGYDYNKSTPVAVYV